MDDIVGVENLCKCFSSVRALDCVSFGIPRGSVFGLLGPNGAGKTTLLRIINNILVKDSGEVFFDSHPLSKADTALLGYMPEERGLYDDMRVDEQIVYFGRLRGCDEQLCRKAMERYMDMFQISDLAHRRVKELSKGNQQKVQIIATMVHGPKLLILDEPFSGFDPINSQLLTELIDGLRAQGTTVVLSSHNMAAIERICSDIALIDKGRVLLCGSLVDIKEGHKTDFIDITLRQGLNVDLLFDSGSVDDVVEIRPVNHRKGFGYRLRRRAGASNTDIITALSLQADVLHFEEVLPSLADIFINYTTR